MFNHEHGPIGVKSGSIEAHWDHTFCGEVALVENGDEFEDAIYQDNCLVTASGIAVPINEHCTLSRFAIAMKGDDGIGSGNTVIVSVLKNGSTVESLGVEPTWDGQTYTSCGRVADDIFAPCDLLSVSVTFLGAPDFPISDAMIRINLGFRIR